MKLLPHAFKWIGLFIFILGFAFSIIDDGRKGFIDGQNAARNDGVEIEFVRIMPEIVSQLADYAILLGLLIYILARNKREDEFFKKLRYESAFLVLTLTITTVLIVYIINPEFELSPSTFLTTQMLAYLIIRSLKKKIILWEDYD